MCLEGHLAFHAAINPEVKAGVCSYATDIHARSLGKGKNDDRCGGMAVDVFRRKLGRGDRDDPVTDWCR